MFDLPLDAPPLAPDPTGFPSMAPSATQTRAGYG